MALGEYHQKREFTKTPEPEGKKPAKTSSKGLRFVVQKHDATRLHFDVRLELDGVMKSWAVPKGPSMNPADKHLAMMVEDHPLDYRKFEGTIPEGNYGAGTVMVWDEGTYTVAGAKDTNAAQTAVKAGLSKGDLKVVFQGKKLQGEFVFFRFARAGENAWIMMKHKDEFAGAKFENEDLSAVSGRTMEQIAGDTAKVDTEKAKVKLTITKKEFPEAVKAAFTVPPSPMLATLVKSAFDDPSWIYEIKWDGYRAVAAVHKQHVQLLSRNGIELGERYREISTALKQLSQDVILDGEIVVLDKEGRSDFQALQNYSHEQQGQLAYCVFDLLYYRGYDLTKVPLLKRKQLLHQVLPKVGPLLFSDHILEQGKQFLKLAKERNLEGIMAKRADSVYTAGKRSSDWQKIKLRNEQEAIICGYTKPEGTRTGFGSLILGVYEKGKLQYAGNVGTGFSEADIEQLMKGFSSIKTEKSPFSDAPKIAGISSWVKPWLVCQIKFSEWTDEGHIRQGSYLGLRDDKSPKEVRREQ